MGRFGHKEATPVFAWESPRNYSLQSVADRINCNVAGRPQRGYQGSPGRSAGAGNAANRRDAIRERRNEINIDWTLIAVIITGFAVIGSAEFFAGGIRQSVEDSEKRLTRVEISLDDLAKGISRLTGMFETFIAMRSDNQAVPKVDGKSDEWSRFPVLTERGGFRSKTFSGQTGARVGIH